MVIMLDSSLSVTPENWQESKKFARTISEKISEKSDSHNIAIGQFSNKAELITDEFIDSHSEVLPKLEKASRISPNNETNLIEVLKFVGRQYSHKSARANSKRILILVVDGFSWPLPDSSHCEKDEDNRPTLACERTIWDGHIAKLKEASDLLKIQQDIEIYTVGVGKLANSEELMQIASSGKDNYYFTISEHKKLASLVDTLLNQVCEVNWWLWIGLIVAVIILIKLVIYILDKREVQQLEH